MHGIHRKAYAAFLQGIHERAGVNKQKRYVAMHTTMNKVTGLLLFMLPLTLTVVPLIYTGIPICSVATFAAVQEGHFIRTGKGIKQKNIPTESGG